MSEVDARTAPTRGRTSTRGGRGGFGRGGPRGGAGAGTGASHRTLNGTVKDIAQAETSTEDSGELGELKSKYGASLGLLKDMFPDWTDVDLVFALQETDGDLPLTIERISEGMHCPRPRLVPIDTDTTSSLQATSRSSPKSESQKTAPSQR